jgi:hypothetical protein
MVKIAGTNLEVEPMTQLPALPEGAAKYAGRDKADALLVPYPYLGIINPAVEAAAIRARFGQVIRSGDGKLYARSPVGGLIFISADPADTLGYPKDHWKSPGADRYDWYADPAEAGVQYGYLRE